MRKLTLKQRVWLDAYLDCFNATEAARRAGYRCKADNQFSVIGAQNLRKLSGIIEKWIDEHGLSEARIKRKIVAGMEAKETRFFAHQGKVVETREVEAHEIQRRYVDMACKVKDLYAPEKHEVSGAGGSPIDLTVIIQNVTKKNDPKSSNRKPD
jgi:phage terminase small subunit